MARPTKDELEEEQKVLHQLKDLLLSALLDDIGHTFLVGWARDTNPNLLTQKMVYKISTSKGDFEIVHRSHWNPPNEKSEETSE
jgi:hypothetical protein